MESQILSLKKTTDVKTSIVLQGNDAELFACHCREETFDNISNKMKQQSRIERIVGAAVGAAASTFHVIGGSSSSKKEDPNSSQIEVPNSSQMFSDNFHCY